MNEEEVKEHIHYAGSHPIVTSHSYLHDLGIFAYVDSLFSGLGLNNVLNGQDVCFENIEIMYWYYFYSYYDLIEAAELYTSTTSFLKGVATISPVLRKCYNFGAGNEAQWIKLADRLFDYENLWAAVKNNIIKSYSDIDRFSWGALLFF